MNIIKKSYDILKSEVGIIIIVNVTSPNTNNGEFFKYKSDLLLKIDDTKAIQYEDLPESVWREIKQKKVYFVEFGPLGVISETLIEIVEEK